MPMSAREFMNQYREMSVRLDGGRSVVVDVHEYLINRSSSPHSTKHALAAWHKIFAAMDKQIREANHHLHAPGHHRQAVGAGHAHGRGHGHGHGHGHATGPSVHGARPAVLSPHARSNPATARQAQLTLQRLIAELGPGLTIDQLGHVPLGKGAPAAVAAYLRLAHRYGLAKTGLQAFADARNVGLDCSGFVTNYFVARGIFTPSAVSERNAASYDERNRRRSRLEDVQSGDVMVWDDHSHVAIIDSVPQRQMVPNHEHRAGHHHRPSHATAPGHGHPAAHSNGQASPSSTRTASNSAHPATGPGAQPTTHAEYTCVVVESNGHRGLGDEVYTLESVSRSVFHVRRQNGTKWEVYINDWQLT